MKARALEHALAVLRLARRIGAWEPRIDTVLAPAPGLTRLAGRKVRYLRGWKAFDGCVKGFNALGLLADTLARDARAFERPVVCSTSANLGLCLHQALALMRQAGLIGPKHGKLVIWCPDPRADFMSAEKSKALEEAAASSGGLTELRLYINRKQRDPSALREAMELGGHFYPTNPQSEAELSRLVAEASGGKPASALKGSPESSIPGAAPKGAIDAGLLGMAAPYVLLLDELIEWGGERALSIWNPASIGAALSALVLADSELQAGARPPGLGEFAPRLAAASSLPETRIHGVFDIANLQSLAQLFGVVSTRHFSGRQTAYVGLGSSSYAVGNLCFEALKASAERGGPFRGREHLHPATHTVNPVAQALAWADTGRKPEPAGAAGVAGYLLARLDGGTLSAAGIAGSLRDAGFDAETFLAFARELLSALASKKAAAARENPARPLDDEAFEKLGPALCLDRSGDNTVQPSEELAARLREKAATSR